MIQDRGLLERNINPLSLRVSSYHNVIRKLDAELGTSVQYHDALPQYHHQPQHLNHQQLHLKHGVKSVQRQQFIARNKVKSFTGVII